MTKWLLLAVVIVVVLWFLGRTRRAGRGTDSPSAADPVAQRQPNAQAQVPPQAMVACAHCGLLLPQADALHGAGSSSDTEAHPPAATYYCSEAHRRAGPTGV